MQSTFDLFVAAVKERKQVTCTYQGYYREFCVHVVGWKHGKEQALVFQFAGESSKGLPPNGEWRCFPLAGLSDVTLKAGAWHTGQGHSRPQTCVDEVHVEIAF